MVIRVGAGRDGWRAGDAYGPDGSTRSGYRPGTEPAGPSAEALIRDREVRQHERAHQKALGPYASTPVMYDGMRAPDGSFVALGGQIGVDLAPVPGDPAATLRKARTVLNAALAPGDPSAADMRVAADAYRLAQDAQDDISAERQARQDPAADPTIEVFA